MSQLVLALVPYTLIAFITSRNFIFVGTDVTLLIVIFLLFIVAQICFQMFVSTFLKRAMHGRILTAVVLVFALFFANLHHLFTLTDDNQSEAVKHVFSVLPVSAFEMIAMVMYERCRRSLPAVRWRDWSNRALAYPVWYAIFWLALDSAVFFALFVLFDLFNSRGFGSPPFRWRDLCRPHAWARKTSYADPDAPIVAVSGLCKTYHGLHDVIALADAHDFARRSRRDDRPERCGEVDAAEHPARCD